MHRNLGKVHIFLCTVYSFFTGRFLFLRPIIISRKGDKAFLCGLNAYWAGICDYLRVGLFYKILDFLKQNSFFQDSGMLIDLIDID